MRSTITKINLLLLGLSTLVLIFWSRDANGVSHADMNGVQGSVQPAIDQQQPASSSLSRWLNFSTVKQYFAKSDQGDQATTGTPDNWHWRHRVGFSVPKLFDFSNYKRLFNKKYSSAVEELARKKLFLARAFRALISAVKYKWRLTSSWLSINHFSDMLPAVLNRLFFRLDPLISFTEDSSANRREKSALLEVDQTSMPSTDDILNELESGKCQSNDHCEGMAELLKDTSILRRKKREASRELSLDDVIHVHKTGVPKLRGVRVASNNPRFKSFERNIQVTVDGRAEEKNLAQAESDDLLPVNTRITETKNWNEIENQIETVAELASNDELFIDHRRSGCIFKPRDQGACASCFIFATIALHEWKHCHDTGKLVAFSEQMIMDCGERMEIKGCEGGHAYIVGRYIARYGLHLREDYPYAWNVKTCPYHLDEDPSVMGYLKSKSEAGMINVLLPDLEEYLHKTPMVFNFCSYNGFLEYGGGVDKPDNICDQKLGHSMLLVGMGRQDGQDYWLLRNSYNSDWGESGYYKLSKDSKCIHGDRGWATVAEFD